jgi:integrase
MARPAKNSLPLPDGRKIPTSVKLRGNIYRVQFPEPDPLKKGKYREVSTGKTQEHEAWREAGKIILAAYTQAGLKPTAQTITWDQVLEALPKSGGKKRLVLKPRTLGMYTDAINALRRTVSTRGPADITPELARTFATLYATTPYTRGNPKTIKRGPKKGQIIEPKKYMRSDKTVNNSIHFLSCLWSRLQQMGYATANPWETVPRPEPAKKAPTAPTEADVTNFFAWLDAKNWEFMSVFLRVKAVAGCRTADLCQVEAHQFNPKTHTLTILATQDKTNRQRAIPLPEELSKRLNAIKGKAYLWEGYTLSIRDHTNDPRAATEFTPERLATAVRRLFTQYTKRFPDRPHIKPHDFRKRAITLTVKATGSVDATGELMGVTAGTAKRHYLDSKAAFEGNDLLKQITTALLPK